MKSHFVLCTAFAVATLAQAQVFEDHTRVRRLTESMTSQNATPCPSGSVLSGGVCVPLIQNQGAYGRSWTSYFVGQRKCGSYGVCATINSDGSVYFNGYWWGGSTKPTPFELAPVTIAEDCGVGLTATPTGMNLATGSAPTGWAVQDIHPRSGACG